MGGTIKRTGGASEVSADCFKILPNGDALICDNKDYKVIRCSRSSNSCATVAGGNGRGSGLNQLNGITGANLFENGDYAISEGSNQRVLRCPADGSGNCEVAISGVASRSMDVGPSGDIFLNQGSTIMKCPAPAVGGTSTCSSVGDPPIYSQWLRVSPRNEPWGMALYAPGLDIWRCREGACENVVKMTEKPISIAFDP